MTPFEQAGYTEHTLFKFVGNCGEYERGTLVKLHHDDGTNCPLFERAVNPGEDTEYLILPGNRAADLEVYIQPQQFEISDDFMYVSDVDGLETDIKVSTDDLYSSKENIHILVSLKNEGLGGVRFTPEQALMFSQDLGALAAKMINEQNEEE